MSKYQQFLEELNKLTKQELILYILTKTDKYTTNANDVSYYVLSGKIDLNLKKQEELINKMNVLPNNYSLETHLEFNKLHNQLNKLEVEFNKLLKERDELRK